MNDDSENMRVQNGLASKTKRNTFDCDFCGRSGLDKAT